MYHSGGVQFIPPIEAGTPAELRDSAMMIVVKEPLGQDTQPPTAPLPKENEKPKKKEKKGKDDQDQEEGGSGG